MGCNNNTLLIGRPTQQMYGAAQCAKGCNDKHVSLTDWVDCSIGPRKNREAVREQIKDYCLLMLGAPTVRIELTNQALDAAVDLALDVFEDYAPQEYFQYYAFDTIPGKSVYHMPCDVGLIRNVFYKQMPNFAFQSSDLGGAIPIEYFYPGGAYASIQGGLIDPLQPIWGRMGEWVLYKQYEYMYSRAASSIGGWEFIGGYNAIKLYPIPFRVHKVVVHYLQKKQDFNKSTQAMREGALSYAKEMLGRIRSFIKNPPGPNGGVQMDGDTLLAEAQKEREKWFTDLITKFGDLLPIKMG